MNLTSAEIFNLVWDRILDSDLHDEVPTMYADHYPNNPKGEFVVVNSLTNAIGETQVATVNVNIYVPDDTPTLNREEQRWPNRRRLGELTQTAFDALAHYPYAERWYFDVSNEAILSEENIPYSFSNIRITFKKY